MKIDGDLWLKTTKRILLDLWAPALVALLITAYGYQTKKISADFFAIAGSALTTLFFVASYFSWMQRAKKFVIDERNHENVVLKQDAVINRLEALANELSGRQDVLVTRLEALAEDLVGHTTGSSSFCLVDTVYVTTTGNRTDLTAPPLIDVLVTVEGKYSLHDVVLDASYLETPARKLSEANQRGIKPSEMHSLIAPDFRTSLGTLRPNVAYPLRIKMPASVPNPDCIGIHLNWYGRNGTWYQRLQLELHDGEWEYAFYVQRDNDRLVEFNTPKYSKDPDGEPIFLSA